MDERKDVTRTRFVAIAALVLVVGASCQAGHGSTRTTIGAARTELRDLIEDVTAATAARYGVTDDAGHTMDGAAITTIVEAGLFAAVYHTWSDRDQAFHVHLATSTDLTQWRWRVELARLASQRAIAAGSDRGYVVAWEQEPDPIHNVLTYYPTWDDLSHGRATRRFDIPITMPACGEGTPAIDSASTSRVALTFHYHGGCTRDRQASGTTDWTTWTGEGRPDVDQAIVDEGAVGHIGDRDSIEFRGHELTLIEGQLRYEDPASWRTFLYDDESGSAEALPFRTAARSVAFSNPSIEQVTINGVDAIVVTLYVLSEGARGTGGGELIYYRTLDDDAA